MRSPNISIFFVGLLALSTVRDLSAETPSPNSREPGALRICTQNLHNFGEALLPGKGGKKKTGVEQHREQALDLVDRFSRAGCDLIGIQEIKGSTANQAKERIQELTKLLSARTQREFEGVAGEIVSGDIRNGFLIARDVFKIDEVNSLSVSQLPKLQVLGPGRRFSRLPLKVKVTTTAQAGGAPKTLVFFVTHMKSKVEGWKDPTHTTHEVTRMEMSEALRRWVGEVVKADPHPLSIVMGDFNAEPESASLDILRGVHELSDFQTRHGCQVDASLHSQCSSAFPPREASLSGVFSELQKQSGSEVGSLAYRGRLQLIDEIYVERSHLSSFRNEEGKLRAWTVGRLGEGSDHKLLVAEMHWN